VLRETFTRISQPRSPDDCGRLLNTAVMHCGIPIIIGHNNKALFARERLKNDVMGKLQYYSCMQRCRWLHISSCVVSYAYTCHIRTNY